MAAAAATCPACGAEQTLHVLRIRCRFCGRRIRADAVVCPYCQRDPRRRYLRPRAFLGMISALGACGLFGLFLWLNAFPHANQVALRASPPATATPRIAIVVVTSPPHALASMTPTESPAASDTATSTLTATITPTPTFRAVRPLPSLTPAAPAAPVRLDPPLLLDPADSAKFSGPKKVVTLSFQPAAPLGENQWYRAQVDYTDRSGAAVSWCGWTQATVIVFPSDYYSESSPDDREFHWHVNVAQVSTANPFSCSAPTTLMGPASGDRTFFWY